MKYSLTIICILLYFNHADAQFGSRILIDDGATSGAVRNLASGDISGNGFNDLLVARGSNIDHLAIYWNSGNAQFDREIIDDHIDDPVFINFGDFNSNGLMDLLVLTESNGEIFFYKNEVGSFAARQLLGHVQSFGKSIAVADFDGNGSLDFVVIGQHSIDFYRNNGSAEFTREPILTTDTSPEILECWTMALTDVNGNGIPDVAVGETPGIVVYINDGTGTFTPQLVSELGHHTVSAIDAFDANGNGKDDLIFHSGNEIGLYINQSQGTAIEFNYHGPLHSAVANSIQEFRTADFTRNGLSDIFFANAGNAYYIENGPGMEFSGPKLLYSEEGLFIWEPLAADLSGNGHAELIWAGAGSTIAYHSLEPQKVDESAFSASIFPNPVSDILSISSSHPLNAKIALYSLSGKLLVEKEQTLPAELNTSSLPAGVYLLKILTEKGLQTQRITKQ